jgi:hypothetical protein
MPTTKTVTLAAVAAAGLSLPLVAFAGPADAAAHDTFHVQKVITKQFVGPLQFAVRGTAVFGADSFTATLGRAGSKHVIARGGNPSKGGDLAGVGTAPGAIGYVATKSEDHSVTKFVVLRHGKKVLVRNLANFEKNRNPDHSVHFGVSNPSSCVRKALKKAQFPVSYKGHVDSHPYSVAFLGNHNWAVADAGGNDILKINDITKKVSVLAVLPSTPLKVTKKFAKASGLPDCTVGVTYATEGVPTDVEAGPNGMLYVSSLPGGPEIPEAGARGRVYRVSPSGVVTKIGDGFAGATNLAVTPGGDVYVAEFGAGRISKLSHGGPKPVFTMNAVVAVEWANGHLYASSAPAITGQQAPGEIVRLAKN